MNDPKRLLEDGDLDPILSSALDEVALGTSAGDLSTLKARVLEAAMAGAVPAGALASAAAADAGWSAASSSGGGALASLGAFSATSTGIAGLMLGALLGAGGHALYVAGNQAPSAADNVVAAAELPREATSSPAMDVPVRNDVDAVSLAVVDDAVSSDAEVRRPLVSGTSAPPATQNRAHTSARAASRRQGSGGAGAIPSAADSASAKPLPSGSTTTSEMNDALSLQLRVYERGEDALKSRRFEAALRELDTYLMSFPNGELEREARLARLDALLGLGRCEEVLSDIVALRADARFKGHHGRLLALEIEALTTLGRCDEAGAVFAGAWLDARSAAAARERLARCRKR